jgi:hypothetical protein
MESNSAATGSSHLAKSGATSGSGRSGGAAGSHCGGSAGCRCKARFSGKMVSCHPIIGGITHSTSRFCFSASRLVALCLDWVAFSSSAPLTRLEDLNSQSGVIVPREDSMKLPRLWEGRFVARTVQNYMVNDNAHRRVETDLSSSSSSCRLRLTPGASLLNGHLYARTGKPDFLLAANGCRLLRWRASILCDTLSRRPSRGLLCFRRASLPYLLVGRGRLPLLRRPSHL